jgi:hypothetical protein
MRVTSAPVPASGQAPRLPSRDSLLIHPRTAGEILDDAWRLYLADAPPLLALSALFTVPAALALLLLLTRPAPAGVLEELVLPAAAAVLFPLTGLGAGACQEWFRRRAEGRPVGLGGCLHAALRRGVDHVTARALVLALGLIGLPLLVMPGLAVWAGLGTVHPLLAAGGLGLFPALSESAREGTRHAGKAFAVTLCRLPLLVLLVLNVAVLIDLVLWVGDNLAGIQTATVGVLLTLENPAYLLALALLAWVLLTPFAEASNFLLHADARARHEGLDLWYRVQRLFAVRALGLVFAAGGLLALTSTARAQPNDSRTRSAPVALGARAQVLREARQAVDGVRQEVQMADPYPGPGRWLPRLRTQARRLDPAGSAGKGPYRWFYEGTEEFSASRTRDAALRSLTGLTERLETAAADLDLVRQEGEAAAPAGPALSREEIKRLLPEDEDTGESKTGAPKETKVPEPRHRPPREQPVEGPDEPGAVPDESGSGVAVPAGLGNLGWYVLAGLGLAVVAVACLLLLQRSGEKPPPPAVESGTAAPSLDNLLSRPEPQTSSALWRQAEELARAGNYLEAVRLLHAAVLALLHRANLIRYEPTRTNGEYLAQVAAAESAGEVQGPFRRLTGLFELKWYGERACSPEDYHACRGLAEEVRAGI